MTGTELLEMLERLGLSIGQAATKLGMDRSHLWRITKDMYPVPGPVKAAVRCWVARKEDNDGWV